MIVLQLFVMYCQMNVNNELQRIWKGVAMVSKSYSLWAGLLGFDDSTESKFSLHNVQFSSEAYLVFYQVHTEGDFLRSKTADHTQPSDVEV